MVWVLYRYESNVKARQMGHHVMVSLWCKSLLTITLFCFFVSNEQLLSTSDVRSRKRAFKGLWEAIKL